MTGMDEVGRLFNNNELIVAEVLQSAEAMKRPSRTSSRSWRRAESANKGTVILATVKGDVTTSENLVEIILGNNGFRVINLASRCRPEDLIAAYREHRPDLIGPLGPASSSRRSRWSSPPRTSGTRACTVRSLSAARRSREVHRREDRARRTEPRLLRERRDAGARPRDKLVDEETREATAARVQGDQARLREAPRQGRPPPRPAAAADPSHDAHPDAARPEAARRRPHSARGGAPVREPAMLYGSTSGYAATWSAPRAGDEKAKRLREQVAAVENEVLARGLCGRAPSTLLRGAVRGRRIVLYGPGDRVVETFTFPRQSTATDSRSPTSSRRGRRR
jgi:5-methyltetrahydrofolate--homocysteine methyltransferase